MPLNVQSRSERNVLILTVSGQLTLGPNLRSLQQTALSAFEAAPPEGVIVDVSGVRYADSAGLGELTVVYSLCSRKHCGLVLAGVPTQLKQLLELTRLDALLPSAPDVEAAKKTLKQGAINGSDRRSDDD